MPRYLAIGVVLILAATACDRLLTEPSPSQVLTTTLQTPQNAPLLVRSAIADFNCAYAQYALASGLVVDELLNAQLQTVAFDMDRRTMTAANTGNDIGVLCETGQQAVGFYSPMQIARFDGEQAATLLTTWTDAQVPGRLQLRGSAQAYEAYALALMGEGMCTDAIDGGPELSADSVLGLAEARFTAAITDATQAADTATMRLAILGRARVRLDRGKPAAAAADAGNIPVTGFEVDATFSGISVRTENRLWSQMRRDNFAGVEGPFQHAVDPAGSGQPDPRVLSDSTGGFGNNGVAIFAARKYPAITSPIPIAHSSEAQLIIAEADVDAHNLLGANAIVNALQTAQGLNTFPPFPDSATAMNAIIVERGRELFLEGHRLSDYIRYGRTPLPLNPAPATPYPYGAGGFYGSQLCFPLPNIERLNNPNIH
jgi:hypothetical protein